MAEEANQSGYWNSCQVIAIAFMYRLLMYSNQRNNILGGHNNLDPTTTISFIFRIPVFEHTKRIDTHHLLCLE